MLNKTKKRNLTRKRRVFRVRKNIKGTQDKPRMSINKSNKHLLVQLIDDENSKTLAAIGTNSKELKGKNKSKETAAILGKKIAKMNKTTDINIRITSNNSLCSRI